jgi:hypothetical protein
MAMNRQMPAPAKIPHILVEDFNPDQVRHDIGKPLVVVTFHPNHISIALGIGEFADITQKLPMFFLEAPEVQITEDVAQ